MNKKCFDNGLFTNVLLCLFGIIGLALMFIKCFSVQAWKDEIYTLTIISYNYKDMLDAIARDVHPPLYYLILKAVVDFAKTVCPEVNTVLLSRIVSMMPFVLFMLINGTLIKESFGSKVALMFAFMITFMPKFMLYNITIRMYSLGWLSVTLTYLMYYRIVFEKRDRYLVFSLCALAAMYTHYFAAVSVAVLLMHMFVLLCWERRSILRLCTSMFGMLVCYVPWFFIALQQMGRVFEDYWIPPLSIRTFLGAASFVVCPPINNDYYDGLICLAVAVLYLYSWIRLWNKNKRLLFFSVTGFNMVAITALFGIVISFIYRPIFIARYLMPSIGSFWLSYAVWIKEADDRDKSIIKIGLIFFLVLGMISTLLFEQRSLLVLLS